MHFKMSSAICFNLDQSKILSSGNALNPVPNNKNLNRSKLKTFADNQLNKLFSKSLENIVEERENAGHQHLLLYPQCF